MPFDRPVYKMDGIVIKSKTFQQTETNKVQIMEKKMGCKIHVAK